MECGEIYKVLNANEKISDIENISFQEVYSDKSYQYIFRFLLTINTTGTFIIMGVPAEWSRKLIDVYIENYKEYKYIPHMGSEGELCLFDLEGVLIDKNFIGLLSQTIDRLCITLEAGLFGLNKKDFIDEFEEYWRRLPGTKVLKSMISPINGMKLVKYTSNKMKTTQKKRERYVDYINRSDSYTLYVADTEKEFNVYDNLQPIRNAVFIHVDLHEFVYPPDWRNELDLDFINGLLKSLGKSDLTKLIHKCSSDLLLIFHLRQPDDITNILGVLIEGFIVKSEAEVLQIHSCKKLIPCNVKRGDKEFLLNRGGALTNLSGKKVLVVGCGSIGGYLVNELVKTGINDIMLVDDDVLIEENIYRHFLGMEYVGRYKTKGMNDYLRKNIPEVNITCLEDNIEDAVYDGNIVLSDYDLIISAVGNHNVNRWINEQMMQQTELNTPVIYLWNEVLGIGNHVAIISTNYPGCYECFFDRDEDGNIYDKTSFCEKGQSFSKKLMGCGSSFLPFSSTNSVTTVVMGMEVIRDYFEGYIEENFLISNKGNDFYFTKAGYNTSNRYKAQENQKITIPGDKFKKDNCKVCSGK